MDARLEGVLVRAADDCMYVRDSVGLTAVVWPNGYTAWRIPGQPVEVVEAEGTVVLREGDKFAVAGGWVAAESSRCDPEGSPFMMSSRPERVG